MILNQNESNKLFAVFTFLSDFSLRIGSCDWSQAVIHSKFALKGVSSVNNVR